LSSEALTSILTLTLANVVSNTVIANQLILNSQTAIFITGSMPGGLTLMKTGAGTLTLSASIPTNVGEIRIAAGTLILNSASALPANIPVAFTGSAIVELGNAATVSSPFHVSATVNTEDPGTAFSEDNAVCLITDSPDGAAFPSGTEIHVTPLDPTASSVVGTIRNNTGLTLRIQPSAVIAGGLVILAPSAE
jgi:autotransporter-associated beta strand protein